MSLFSFSSLKFSYANHCIYLLPPHTKRENLSLLFIHYIITYPIPLLHIFQKRCIVYKNILCSFKYYISYSQLLYWDYDKGGYPMISSQKHTSDTTELAETKHHKFHVKDPGSALTHFIAMIGAVIAAASQSGWRSRFAPSCGVGCVYRQHDSALCRQHDLPHL